MNRVLTSLCVFAFTGFILSTGITAFGSALCTIKTVFVDGNHPQKHALLSYERTY